MNRKGNIESGIDMLTLTTLMEPPVPPPPLGFSSPFKSIDEWLSHLCATYHTKKSIEEFYIFLVERPLNNLLGLQGYNRYIQNDDTISYRMEFKPESHQYFALTDQYNNLAMSLLHEKMKRELFEFTTSPKFENSFLSKSNSITTNFANKIWER